MTEQTMTPDEVLEELRQMAWAASKSRWGDRTDEDSLNLLLRDRSDARVIDSVAALIARNAELEGLLQIVRDTIPHVGGNAASVNELVRRIDAARAEAGHG